MEYPEVIEEAGKDLNPAHIANYAFDLVKLFNSFYQSMPIVDEEHAEQTKLRLAISRVVGEVTKSSLGLLGIGVPNKM